MDPQYNNDVERELERDEEEKRQEKLRRELREQGDPELDKDKTIAFLQGELERISSPPYVAGTLLTLGEKTARVAVDGKGAQEVPLTEGIKEKFKIGSRVVLNPGSYAIIDSSEFPHTYGDTVTVEGVEENRLRVISKGEPKYVLNSLPDLKSGDEVLLDHTGSIAVEKFSKKKTKYALEEVPVAPWDRIGGLEGVITKIKTEIESPLKHPEIYERHGKKPIKGILLLGPPGCGKTMIAESIAYTVSEIKKQQGIENGHFIRVNAPEILDKWLGNSEANIRRIYEAARESGAIVFIDEAEAILKARGTGISSDIFDTIVPQFLGEMNGFGSNDKAPVMTILATNRDDIIDPAILRDERIDLKLNIPRPDRNGAKQIFGIYLSKKPLKEGAEKIAEYSEMLTSSLYDNNRLVYTVVSPGKGALGNFSPRHILSGAMIKGIVERADSYSIEREISGGEAGVTKEDLSKALEEKLRENAGFPQALVRTDWEDVFGSQGRQYQTSYNQGYLVLENMLDHTVVDNDAIIPSGNHDGNGHSTKLYTIRR